MKPFLLDKTIRLFLDSIGKREEYQYYLRRFHDERSVTFAVLCPEAAGFEEAASFFEFDMQFLLRLDLAPLILLCGPDAAAMREILLQEDHFYRHMELPEVPGDALLRDLTDAVRAAHEDGRAVLLSADHLQPGDLLPVLLPVMGRRVHFIRLRGPLRTVEDQPLNYYASRRPDRPSLAEQDQPLARLADRVLEQCPGTHISIATPWNLLQELFTVKGAGCVVRHGSVVRHITDAASLDAARLLRLIEDSFGKPVRNPRYLEAVTECYLEEQYRGAALLERHPAGRYLSKFSVSAQARGEGLANELWEEIVKNPDPLFWRARPGNPINAWYERQATGWQDTPGWRIFWRGADWERIPDLIRYALARPDDFAAGTPGAS